MEMVRNWKTITFIQYSVFWRWDMWPNLDAKKIMALEKELRCRRTSNKLRYRDTRKLNCNTLTREMNCDTATLENELQFRDARKWIAIPRRWKIKIGGRLFMMDNFPSLNDPAGIFNFLTELNNFTSLNVFFLSGATPPPAREIQSSYRLYGGVWSIWP